MRNGWATKSIRVCISGTGVLYVNPDGRLVAAILSFSVRIYGALYVSSDVARVNTAYAYT